MAPDDTDDVDPRAGWRHLPPDVVPTGTTLRTSVVAADFDMAQQFDPQTETVRPFW